MTELTVTIQGRSAKNTTENGIVSVGTVCGTMRAVVAWHGEWIPGFKAQEDAVIALFPEMEIDSYTITPKI